MINTYKVFLSVLLFLCFTNYRLNAQSETQFNHIILNQVIVNPGAAGSSSKDLFNVMALNRNQTAGFNGAPVTTAININGPLNLGGVNGGVSLSLSYDKAGFFTSPGFNLGYAYRTNVLKGTLGIGVSAGLLISSLDPEAWIVPEGSNNDPAIPTQKTSKAGFDAGIGVHYADERWDVGVSCLHLTQPTITNVETASSLKQNFYLIAGYKFTLPSNADIELKPSVVVSTDFASSTYLVNAQIDYKKRYWAGVNYRFNNSVGAMVGVNLFSTLKIGYSYDYSTSALGRFSNGSHEIMLSYSFALIRQKGKQKYKSIRYL